MSAFGEFFMGSPARTEQVQRFTPEQLQAFQQMQQLGMQGLQSGGTAGFEPIAAQERQDFQRKTIPSIAERFASMGGGQQSSAFQQTMAQAGADLNTRLAALKANYGLQGMKNYQNMANMGLTSPWENIYMPATPSLLGQVAQGAAQGYMRGSGGDWLTSLFKKKEDDGKGNTGGGGQQQQQQQQTANTSSQGSTMAPMLANTASGAAQGFATGGMPGALIGGGLSALSSWLSSGQQQEPQYQRPYTPGQFNPQNITSAMLNYHGGQYAGVPTTPQFSFLH
jgi:hypothetical protein